MTIPGLRCEGQFGCIEFAPLRLLRGKEHSWIATEHASSARLALYVGLSWSSFQICSWMITRYGLSPRLQDLMIWMIVLMLPLVLIAVLPASRDTAGHWARWVRWVVPLHLLLSAVVLLLVFRRRPRG